MWMWMWMRMRTTLEQASRRFGSQIRHRPDGTLILQP